MEINDRLDTLLTKIDELQKTVQELRIRSINEERELLYEDEVALILGLSVRTLNRLRRDGEIGYVTYCREIRYSWSHLDQFVESHQRLSKEELRRRREALREAA